MLDRETVITHLQIIHTWAEFARERDLQFFTAKHLEDIAQWSADAIAMLKEQGTPILTIVDAVSELMDRHYDRLEEQETEWEHLWDAPDGTFKGRCKKCGFVHFFIEGHDTQYKFCPECGRSVK